MLLFFCSRFLPGSCFLMRLFADSPRVWGQKRAMELFSDRASVSSSGVSGSFFYTVRSVVSWFLSGASLVMGELLASLPSLVFGAFWLFGL